MCGISGFVDYSKKTGQPILEQMNRIMSHRGPDGEGYAIYQKEEASIGLGHRRLSIIDLTQGGSQPQSFGSLHITFNGEIYNHLELRKKYGLVAESNSDTLTLLMLFELMGMKMLDEIDGMFAFALYDAVRAQRIACMRSQSPASSVRSWNRSPRWSGRLPSHGEAPRECRLFPPIAK